MPITFEDVSASIEAPPPAAEPARQDAAQAGDDELPERIDALLRRRSERLARLATD